MIEKSYDFKKLISEISEDTGEFKYIIFIGTDGIAIHNNGNPINDGILSARLELIIDNIRKYNRGCSELQNVASSSFEMIVLSKNNRKPMSEGLDIKDITDDEIEKLSYVAFKTFFDYDYHRSNAVLDIIKICGANDTSEIRRLVAIAFNQGEYTAIYSTEIEEDFIKSGIYFRAIEDESGQKYIATFRKGDEINAPNASDNEDDRKK